MRWGIRSGCCVRLNSGDICRIFSLGIVYFKSVSILEEAYVWRGHIVGGLDISFCGLKQILMGSIGSLYDEIRLGEIEEKTTHFPSIPTGNPVIPSFFGV